MSPRILVVLPHEPAPSSIESSQLRFDGSDSVLSGGSKDERVNEDWPVPDALEKISDAPVVVPAVDMLASLLLLVSSAPLP